MDQSGRATGSNVTKPLNKRTEQKKNCHIVCCSSYIVFSTRQHMFDQIVQHGKNGKRNMENGARNAEANSKQQ